VRRVFTAWLASLALALPPARLAAQDAERSPESGRGLKLLQMQGCTACHSLDGSTGVGPSLAGRFGSSSRVIVDGREAEVRFDALYLARSLAAPDEAVAVGYPAGVMPPYQLSTEQLQALSSAVAQLPASAGTATPGSGLAIALAAAGAALVLGSALALRARRRARRERTTRAR